MRIVLGLIALWLVLVILGAVVKAVAWLVGVGIVLVVITVVVGALLGRGGSRDVDRL